MSMFLIFANLVKTFKITSPPGIDPPSYLDYVEGFLHGPKPFVMKVEER